MISSAQPIPAPKPVAPPRLGLAPQGTATPIGAPAPQMASTAATRGAPPPQMAPTVSLGGAPSAGPAPIPLAAGSGTPYASAQPNSPGGAFDYLSKTITPGAGVDRLALAKSNFENFKDSTEPEYQAALREAGQSGAAAGQVGSGMLRGRLGDIGLARTRDLQSAETSNLNNATEGGIQDAYNNIGIAQQQQGFQAGQQQSAFGQGVTQQELNDQLINSNFNRNATTLQLGDSGNPSDVGLALSGYYGNQAGQSGQAAANLLNQGYLARALTPKAA